MKNKSVIFILHGAILRVQYKYNFRNENLLERRRVLRIKVANIFTIQD